MTDDAQTSGFVLELPTYESIEDYDVDVSDLSDEQLAALEDANDDLLNTGDVRDFPTDEALQASFALARQIRDEREDRDPRRNDPYFDPDDTTDRFELRVVAVEIYSAYGETHIRLTFEDESTFTAQGNADIVRLILDHHGIGHIRAVSQLYARSIPVVGGRTDPNDHEEPDRPWIRVDRYALEHGEPAI